MVSEIPDFANVFIKRHRKKPMIIPGEDFLAIFGAIRKSELRLTKRPKGWWRVFLDVAHYLVFSRGEILSLSWDKINFTTLDVRVRASTSKSRKERMVPMAPEMAKVLEEWKVKTDQSSSSDPVLPWSYDTYRQLYQDWHLIQEMAGIPEDAHYVPKNCRSTCASELIANQVPTVVVKDFLDHATVATTENYYINTKPAMRAAAKSRKVQMEPEESNSPVP